MNPPEPAHIIANLTAQSKKEALIELTGLFEGINQEHLVRTLLDREALGSTAIIPGIALPHAKIDTIDELLFAVGRSERGIHWGSRDSHPVHLIFLMLAPEAGASYLQTLASLSRVLKSNSNCTQLQNAENADEIHLILRSCFQSSETFSL